MAAVLYMPTEQAEHADAITTEAYVPAAQSLQPSDVVTFLLALKRPTGQKEQAVERVTSV